MRLLGLFNFFKECRFCFLSVILSVIKIIEVVTSMKIRVLIGLMLFLLLSYGTVGQQFRHDMRESLLRLEVVQSTDAQFVFNTHQSILMGQIIPNALVLGVIAENTDTWNFSVYAEPDDGENPDEWEQILAYSNQGELPQIRDLEIRVRNNANTTLIPEFTSMGNILDRLYIIPESVDLIDCPGQGTNVPGSYLTDPACYRFRVDLRFKPSYGMQPGLYRLRIIYEIKENL